MPNLIKRAALSALLFSTISPLCQAQWTTLTTSPAFSKGAGMMLLLTDGRVLVQNFLRADWKILTPDASGSYINGTWSSGGSMQAGYEPLYYASAVLADGRVVVIGGEYISSGGSAAQSSDGAIYNPATNSWSQFLGPASYTGIGDSQCAVLPDGRFMLSRRASSSKDYAIWDPFTATWIEYDGATQGKADRNSEEGWTLLPDGTILCVDCSNGNHAEKYNIATNTWISAGETITTLPSNGGLSIVPEMGPHVLMNDGKTFCYGASGNTGVYTMGALPTDTGSWISTGTLSIGGLLMTAFDAPGAILPDGRALVAVSPAGFNTPSHIVQFDGSTITQVPDPAGAAGRQSYEYRMLVLPNGQVMLTDSSNTVQIYTAGSSVGDNAWRPVLDTYPSRVIPGRNYQIFGKQFNGLTEGSYYGDDAANSTNFPIVRINNGGNVFYCRTHDHSTMAIATGNETVSTNFEVKSDAPDGASTIQVVANGIPSFNRNITVERKKPITAAHLSGTIGNNDWFVSDVTVSFSFDVLTDTGVVTHHKLDGGADSTSATITVNSDSSNHIVEFWSENPGFGADGVEPHQFVSFKRDATKPTLAFGAQTPVQNGFGWNNTDVSIPYTTGDATSGVASAIPGSPVVFTAEGLAQNTMVTVTDNAGNQQSFVTANVNIDKTKPQTTDSEPVADGCNGWYHGPVTVTLDASDNLSGVQFTKYRVDGGAVQTYGSPFIVSGDQVHTVEYWSTDKADNEENHHSFGIKIDGTPPSVSGNANLTVIWPPNGKLVPVTISGSMTDNLSGIDPSTSTFHVVDEYGLVQPSGSITVNPDGSYSLTTLLEASRLGTDKDGRTYTIYVKVSDMACNETTISLLIVVPHDKRG